MNDDCHVAEAIGSLRRNLHLLAGHRQRRELTQRDILRLRHRLRKIDSVLQVLFID